MPIYTYRILGRTPNNTYTVSGEIVTMEEGDIPTALNMALQDSFRKVTTGKDVEYGHPGPCGGPYKILSFHLERV